MTRKNKKANDQRIYRWGIAVIVLLLILLLLTMCHSSVQKPNNEVLIPDLAPDETEPNVETIPNDTSTKADSTNGGSVRLTYSDKVTIDLSEEVVTLYFGNPGRSNQDMILRIVIQDEVIAQSGLIPSGYQVETIALLPDVASLLQVGKYSGKFMIFYYDQKTSELATVNTEIPITVVVGN